MQQLITMLSTDLLVLLICVKCINVDTSTVVKLLLSLFVKKFMRVRPTLTNFYWCRPSKVVSRDKILYRVAKADLSS